MSIPTLPTAGKRSGNPISTTGNSKELCSEPFLGSRNFHQNLGQNTGFTRGKVPKMNPFWGPKSGYWRPLTFQEKGIFVKNFGRQIERTRSSDVFSLGLLFYWFGYCKNLDPSVRHFWAQTAQKCQNSRLSGRKWRHLTFQERDLFVKNFGRQIERTRSSDVVRCGLSFKRFVFRKNLDPTLNPFWGQTDRPPYSAIVRAYIPSKTAPFLSQNRVRLGDLKIVKNQPPMQKTSVDTLKEHVPMMYSPAVAFSNESGTAKI
jgi:hypothetical protein